jgi:hypothetical protein
MRVGFPRLVAENGDQIAGIGHPFRGQDENRSAVQEGLDGRDFK